MAFFNARLLLATLGVAVASGVAAAAEPNNTSDLNEIVVQSPRVTTEYSPWLRARVERYTATVRVGYSDLNLTDTSGVQVFQARVRTAAQLACQKLNHLIPVSDLACLEDTLTAMQPRVQAVLGAAMQGAAPGGDVTVTAAAAPEAKQERARL
jgi:UrcA family protein